MKTMVGAFALTVFFGTAAMANPNTAVTAGPPTQESEGTVVDITANGNLIVIDHASGEMHIATAAGLQVGINPGDTVRK